MRTDSAMNPGRLHLEPKVPYEYGDDGTTTRAGKAAAMAGGIDLRLPVRSMRAHRQTRTRIIVFAVWVCVGFGVGLLSLRWMWPALGRML